MLPGGLSGCRQGKRRRSEYSPNNSPAKQVHPSGPFLSQTQGWGKPSHIKYRIKCTTRLLVQYASSVPCMRLELRLISEARPAPKGIEGSFGFSLQHSSTSSSTKTLPHCLLVHPADTDPDQPGLPAILAYPCLTR